MSNSLLAVIFTWTLLLSKNLFKFVYLHTIITLYFYFQNLNISKNKILKNLNKFFISIFAVASEGNVYIWKKLILSNILQIVFVSLLKIPIYMNSKYPHI